ncbi:uncharacterized protein LOC122084844 [Macadamia integrifolia]|uniref:uncharacterized protein LOC122084844 n=1 Tax=Macadamia integrifolia TaxID=60698 RepID=UPI001C4F4A50|nr:uncharacterized protein LOC122084844 [Macadamia integrifolia]
MAIYLMENGKYECHAFVEEHNHPLHISSTMHFMRSQRKISEIYSYKINLADDSGINPKAAFELMGRQTGGAENLGYVIQDQKNYLRTKRQHSSSYGEAGSLLKYFENQSMNNPSFTYSMQLDSDEQITNIFWADPKMRIDYAQFGDVVNFDTTFCTNKEYRPFGIFAGFNHHRGVIIFGVALLYDETTESFSWLFEQKKPITIFTVQDAAMAKALLEVWPETRHGLCIWHIMQNGIKHLGNMMKDGSGFFKYLKKCIFEYEEKSQFEYYWNKLLRDYNLEQNSWVVNAKRDNELKTEFDSRDKLPRNIVRMSLVIKQAGDVYTPYIFERFQEHCRKYETFGILCCHSLKVLDVFDIKCIPDTYILRRWTRAARSMVVEDHKVKQVVEDVNLDCIQRYKYLCPQLVKIALQASNSVEGFALIAFFPTSVSLFFYAQNGVMYFTYTMPDNLLEKVNLKCLYSKAKIVGTLGCITGALAMSFFHAQPCCQNGVMYRWLGLVPNDITLQWLLFLISFKFEKVNLKCLYSKAKIVGTLDKAMIIGCLYLIGAVFILSSLCVIQAQAMVDFPAPMSLSVVSALMDAILTGIVQLIQEHSFSFDWPLVNFRIVIGAALLVRYVVLVKSKEDQIPCVET